MRPFVKPKGNNLNLKSNSINARMQDFKNSWQLYAMIFLPVLWLFLFRYQPMYGAQIAFKDFSFSKGIWGSPWAGFKYFDMFINSHVFWRVIRNTFGIGMYRLIAATPFPIILALMLNYVKNKSIKKTVQMVTYAPYFISSVILMGIVIQFLDPRIGLINNFIKLFGASPVNFIAKPEYFKTIFVTAAIWQNTGYNSIIYLAQLSTVSTELYEAAKIDGANKFQLLYYIDFPSIVPTLVIVTILNAGRVMSVAFERVLLLQNSLNLPASEVIQTYVYKIGLSAEIPQYSYAAAIGFFMSIINILFIMTFNILSKRLTKNSLW